MSFSEMLREITGVLILLLGKPVAGQSWDRYALREFLGFTDSEWKTVEGGGVVAKTLKTKYPTEVAVLGAVRADSNTACFLTHFNDIEKFKKSSVVLQVHKFRQPPGLGDLAGLKLEEKDLLSLRGCREGNCGVKLPSLAISSIARAGPGSNAAFREWLLNYVETYLAKGNDALAEYHDKSAVVRLAVEFRSLLDAEPSLLNFAPGFYRFLAQYPSAPAQEVSEFLYWSEENFGLKPVASVTHVNILSQRAQAIIASKQIYASHYFDGSLGLTFLLDFPDSSPRSMYIVYLNRSRVDVLRGWLSGLRRLVLRGRLLDGFRQNLKDVALRLASSCPPGS